MAVRLSDIGSVRTSDARPYEVKSVMKTSVDFLCSMFVKQVNKQPDEGLTGDKNHGKDQDGLPLPLEPAVDQINDDIGKI